MLFIQINRKEDPRSYKRNFNTFEKKAFKIHAGLCLYCTKTLDNICDDLLSKSTLRSFVTKPWNYRPNVWTEVQSDVVFVPGQN